MLKIISFGCYCSTCGGYFVPVVATKKSVCNNSNINLALSIKRCIQQFLTKKHNQSDQNCCSGRN